MVKYDGTPEAAEDEGGVLRDALTEFFETFYLQYTVGNDYVVPVLRHDMTRESWMAVAAVIRLGLKQERVFPRKLAPPFLHQAILGECPNPVPAFLRYLPLVDRNVLEDAMKDVSSVDDGELADLMERLDAKTIPTNENIHRIVSEIAHKEIIQTPMFVADCWNVVLKSLNITAVELDRLYESLEPTTRKVLNILRFPDVMGTAETSLAASLKRLVREMDAPLLGCFLRFCTGSDLIATDHIDVNFSESSVRCPTSHTCTSLLEIPRAYATEQYVTFKSEFANVLKSQYWQMDFV